MDTKRTVIGMILITILVLGYTSFLNYEYKLHPEWKQAANSSTTAPPQSEPSTPTLEQGPALAAQPEQEAPGWTIIPSTQPTCGVMLGSNQPSNAKYHLAVNLDPAGAAVDSVILNQYLQESGSPDLFAFQTPYDIDPDGSKSLATRYAIFGQDSDGRPLATDLLKANWTLDQHSDNSATYQIDLAHNGKPALRICKRYSLTAASDDPATPQGYELNVDYFVQNLSTQKQSVALAFNGPTAPLTEAARQTPEIVAGYNDDGIFNLDHRPVTSLKKPPAPGQPDPNDFLGGAAKVKSLLWMGMSGAYFNAIVRPENSGALTVADAVILNPDASGSDWDALIRLQTNSLSIAPGATASVPLHVFIGPKTRKLLNSAYYSALPRNYDQTLVMIGGCFLYAFCTSATLINALVALLDGLHWVLHDWGLAIIALVCIVRVCLHPLTKRSQVQMMKMQKLGPEIERLKKKYADDKDEFSKQQMELYKSIGFTPILGCAPMFLQMPIFFALWRALQSTFELRQAPFHFTWIHDLAQPDQLIKFPHPIPLFIFGMHLSALNILPLAMAVATFVNMKYFTPRPPSTTPEQEQQQKMMVWMTLIFPVMLYNFPSGLNLYYLTSTGLGILESKRIRAHIKQLEEEAARTGPVIVDGGSKISSKVRRVEPKSTPAKKGFWGKLQELQERAEQIAREQERQRKKR